MEQDITRLEVNGKEVILVGTAHISQQSVDLVQNIIKREQPDAVCVELDEQRFKALREQQRWEELDLREIIRQKKLMFLMARLALMAFQKRMGAYTGVKPGAEMAAAVDAAEDLGANVVLCDRDVQITLLRAWRLTPLWKRAALAASLFFGLFERTEVSEEELADLRESANISGMLDELGEAMPEVKDVLVDERDTYMASEILEAEGERVIVVIGAAHKPGITRKLRLTPDPEELQAVQVIPKPSPLMKVVPWILPAIILGVFAYGFYAGDYEQLKRAAVAWVLLNGVLSSIGALAALAHPLTVASAFLAAPITSLNPTMGAGMVTALVQTFMAPPRVKDLEQVGDDVLEVKKWWTNRLIRVFLVFVFSSIGSSIGTFAALYFLKDLL